MAFTVVFVVVVAHAACQTCSSRVGYLTRQDASLMINWIDCIFSLCSKCLNLAFAVAKWKTSHLVWAEMYSIRRITCLRKLFRNLGLVCFTRFCFIRPCFDAINCPIRYRFVERKNEAGKPWMDQPLGIQIPKWESKTPPFKFQPVVCREGRKLSIECI